MEKILVKDKSGFSGNRGETVRLSAADCRTKNWEMQIFGRF